MFGSLGMTELILIFVIALIVFGPKKLPELGKSLGKGLREFKRTTDDLKANWDEHIREAERSLEVKDEPKLEETKEETKLEEHRPEEHQIAAPDNDAESPHEHPAPEPVQAAHTEPHTPEPVQNKPIE